MADMKYRAAKRYEISLHTQTVELDGRFYTYFRAYNGKVYSLCVTQTETGIDGVERATKCGLNRRVRSKATIAKLNELTA